jgi:hypothetical protein
MKFMDTKEMNSKTLLISTSTTIYGRMIGGITYFFFSFAALYIYIYIASIAVFQRINKSGDNDGNSVSNPREPLLSTSTTCQSTNHIADPGIQISLAAYSETPVSHSVSLTISFFLSL